MDKPPEENHHEINKQIDILLAENKSLKTENALLKKEIKKAESAIPKLTNLSLFNGAFNDVFSEIAHEINNPINFVMSSVSIVKRGVEDYTELMSMYKKIEGIEADQSYKKILELEDDIDLTLTQQELSNALQTINKGFERIQEVAHNLSLIGKRVEAIPLKLNVNHCIDETLFIIKSKLKDKIEVRTSYGKLPLIKSYKGKLNQLFINLFQNAIEAIQQQHPDKGGMIEIQTQCNNNNVIIDMKDNGIGMTAETVDKAFDKFFTTKSPDKGTGLGMSVSKDIVELHHGSIVLESEREMGSKITITLPLDYDKVQASL